MATQRNVGDKVTEPGRSIGAGGIGEATWTIIEVLDSPEDGRFYKLARMGAKVTRPGSQVENWALFAPSRF